LHLIVSNPKSHTKSYPKSHTKSSFPEVARRRVYYPTRIHGTRANIRKMADFLEQENQLLKEEIATMQAKINEMAAMQTQVDELTELVRTLRAAQNQPLPPPPPARTRAKAGGSAILDWTICSESPTFSTPPRSAPWFSPFTSGEILRPIACEPPVPTFQPTVYTPPPVPTHHQSEPPVPIVQHAIYVPSPAMTRPQATMTYSAPTIHIVPQNEEPIIHSANMGGYDRVDELQKIMNWEIRALSGKEAPKKDVYDLCLASNVQIPHKFKLPDFEKYEGTSCPKDHLTMYVRKMSMYANDHQVLIHYFQDSLTGTALKWYMNLDRVEIRTFNDLREAFVRQYKFNMDMAPDRSDLQAMTQKDDETFREYAQQWRNVATQVSPHVGEKEMIKLFLKTLSQFYYEMMVGSVPRDFSEMVSISMRLEEGVREGQLTTSADIQEIADSWET